MTRRDAALLALIVVAGAALRAPLLREGLWRDEASTYYDVAAHGLTGTLSMIARIELAPPMYFLLEKAWVHVAGVGSVALKLPSFVYGVALILATYALGRAASSPAVGLFAGLCACVSQPAIDLAAQARNYSFATLMAALVLWAYSRALRDDRPSPALLWFAGLGTLLAYANYAGSLLLALLAVAAAYALGSRRDWARLGRFAAAFAAVALLYAPWIPTMLAHARIGAPFQERTTAATFVNIVNRDFGHLLPAASRHGQIGIAFALGLIVWLFALLVRFGRDRASVGSFSTEPRSVSMVGVLAFCTICGLCVSALLSLSEPRYVFVFAPAAWVWFGWIAWRFGCWFQSAYAWQKIAVSAAGVLVLAAFVPSERAARYEGPAVLSGIRDLAPRAAALDRSDHALFVVAPDYLGPTFGYYVGRVTGVRAHGFARWYDPEVFVTRGYLRLWTDPRVLGDVEGRIAIEMARGDDRLCLIRDAILIDRGRVPFMRANALFAWLRRRYRLVSAAHYPGKEEDVIMEIFAPRRTGSGPAVRTIRSGCTNKQYSRQTNGAREGDGVPRSCAAPHEERVVTVASDEPVVCA